MPSGEAPPIPLLSGETVVQMQSAQYLLSTAARMGFNPILGTCWLTSHRVIFESLGTGVHLNRPVAFPLSRIATTSLVRFKVEFITYNAVRLDFDDGGVEYFQFKPTGSGEPRPGGVEAWQTAIDSARASAPACDYEVATTKNPSVETAGKRGPKVVLYVVGGIVAAVLACCVILAITGSLLPSSTSRTPTPPRKGAMVTLSVDAGPTPAALG